MLETWKRNCSTSIIFTFPTLVVPRSRVFLILNYCFGATFVICTEPTKILETSYVFLTD